MNKRSVLLFAGLICVLFFSAGCSCSKETTSKIDITEPVALKVVSTDGKLEGLVGVTIENGRVMGQYQVRIKDALPDNGVCMPGAEMCIDSAIPPTYTYAQRLVVPGEEKDDNGSLGTAYCNKDKLPTDAFTDFEGYYNAACDSTAQEESGVFFGHFSRGFDSLAELKTATTYELYDSSDYWYEEEPAEKDPSGITYHSYTTDMEKAVRENEPTKTYTLQYSEL